jgi:hypothetical protein
MPHKANPGEHSGPAALGNQQQRLHRGLPLLGIVLGLGQLRDVERGVAKRDQRVPVRQFDWIEEPLIPGHDAREPPLILARDVLLIVFVTDASFHRDSVAESPSFVTALPKALEIFSCFGSEHPEIVTDVHGRE